MAFTFNREEQLLLSRLDDLCAGAEKYCQSRFLGFLDQRQQRLCNDALRYRGCFYRFFGGSDGTERAFLGVSCEAAPTEDTFPISCLELSFRKEDSIGHRDILGALMGLNIAREAVGDIMVQPGQAWVFLSRTVLPVVAQELTKVGRCGVKCQEVSCGSIIVTPSFEALSGSLSSLRLDCTVAFLAQKSRSEAVRLIVEGKVALDGLEETDPTYHIQEGCRISIRGYGKFIFDGQQSFNKKHKLRVSFLRYI